MFRSILAYRHRGVAAAVVAVAIAVPSTLALSGAFAASSSPEHMALLRQQNAQHLLKLSASHYRTWPAQLWLQMQATGNRSIAQQPFTGSPAGQPEASGPQVATPLIPSAGLPNVRVNNPGEDTHQTDQTTQSETTIAVAGSHVAVGFNDSQTTGLIFTAGSSLTGYAYSTNGGASFTDGGPLANAPELQNLGDPWMGSARNGTMYFSNLAGDGATGNLLVSVSKSTNGGKTWGTPVPVNAPPSTTFVSSDKDALAVGPDPVMQTRDNIYVAYDDNVFNTVTGTSFNGLPVARSIDGGKTWHVTYADKFAQPTSGCSFEQYIGSTPIVNPANGALYVTAERINVNDPNCTGTQPALLSEWFFKSVDGGQTFQPGVKIADITAAEPDGELHLGPGRFARTVEFPSPALLGNNIYVAWNDGTSGHSHIRLAKSTNHGATWTSSFINTGAFDDVQPALATDSHGLHILYYHRNANLSLDVIRANSANGTSFTYAKVNTVTFRGSLSAPQFDPIIAFGYMGDYIANVTVGGHEYFAWGDNRDTVKDFLYPQGRNDPDVFFAKH
jgi:hypothetical protein